MKKSTLSIAVVLSVVFGLAVETANAQWRRATEQEFQAAPARILVAQNAEPQASAAPAPRAAQDPTARRQAPGTTTTPAPRTKSRMTSNDLEAQHERVMNLTSITVGKPLSFEESRSYNQGYYGFQGMNLPGSIYPQFSSLQPARDLPGYIQQELFEEFQRSGEFNPLLPGTGQMGQQLPVLSEEARIGKGVMRTGPDGNPMRVKIGPETWSTTNYVVVSSIGILEEVVQGRQINGQDIVRITDSIPGIGGRARRILWDTVGRSQTSGVDRMIVGIVYVAIVDLETRSVLKSCTGVAAMSYTEFAATDLPAIRMQTVRYAGAGKFARELVLSAMYDETDRDKSVEKFLQRRNGTPAQKTKSGRVAARPGQNPFTTVINPVDDPERPILRRR